MTHVHYKFSSKLSYDTVVFDGPNVTLKDLKRQIMDREKLRTGFCDLQITNAQTKEEYKEDEGQIPKGSSVIVRRIPIVGVKSSSSKIRNIERSDVQQLHHGNRSDRAMDDRSSSRDFLFFSKMANLAEADVSEEDKIKVMMNQSAYDSMNYNTKFGAVLPANYTCYRCGNTGHHIRNCPNSRDKNAEAPVRIKKSTGIPRSFMVEVDDPSIKGAMLTNCGRFAIPAIDAQAYAIGKKEKPAFAPQQQPEAEEEEDPAPDELLCLICRDLLSDAVVIPCCGNSYCDDCIRTALLDSEEHVCPTCSQSDVSPDTLIANKFLRQAVNTFNKERGHPKSLSKGCDATQSHNPTPTPSPAPTPPPAPTQIQPQKPQQTTTSQQDPLLHSEPADTPPSSQESETLPTLSGPASAPSTPSRSLQTEQSHLETTEEPEEKTPDDSVAASPTGLVSHTAPPLVNYTTEVNEQQSSSACPMGGWTESTPQQLPPSSSSSSYPTVPPPLFPSPLFQTFLATQPPPSLFPPGYPPATPIWALPTLTGAPIPPLCPSIASSSSIPALMPNDWYMYHRKRKERSPHRGSTYRRSSKSKSSHSYPSSRSRSRSRSKGTLRSPHKGSSYRLSSCASKSKSSHSHPGSSSRSRSRSRSRSKGRSRHPHSHSHSSQAYSYGYKRLHSPTTSSSSSPRVGHQSRLKSPSDHRKSSHHRKKSATSSSSSRRGGERSNREEGGSAGSSASHLCADQMSSLELDRQRYFQWKREYKDWCEKYLNSYLGHFHQLPPPLLNPPPCPFPQEGSRNHSHDRNQGRRSALMDGRSPPSQSSSDSSSLSSQSSSDSSSTPSSNASSSPSHLSNDSRSPPSQTSSGGRSTHSEDGAQQRRAEKYSVQPVTRKGGSEEVEQQERSKDDKQLIVKNLENLSTLKTEKKHLEKHEQRRGEAADSLHDCKSKESHIAAPNATIEEEAADAEALASVEQHMKQEKCLDKEYERKSREKRNMEGEKSSRRDKYLDSGRNVERRHKEKSSRRTGSVDTDRYRNTGRSKASDSRSEESRKRKAEDAERRPDEAQSSKYLQTNITVDPETFKNESLDPFERKKQKPEKKHERKTWPTKKDIWEEGIKVKPQKKISINIKLDGKQREEQTERQDASFTGHSNVDTEQCDEGEEETEVGDDKESSREQGGVFEDKIKAEGEARQMWERATFRDEKGEKKSVRGEKEDKEFKAFELLQFAFKGEEEESENQRVDDDRMEAGEEGEYLPKEEPMEGVKRRMRTEEDDAGRSKSQRSRNESSHDRPNTAVDDGSGSYEDCQQRKAVVTTLEEHADETSADRGEELVLIQVPRSKWEKEELEEEEPQPSPCVSVTAEATTIRETEGEKEQKRYRSVEKERDRAVERGRGRDREKNRGAAPSSGRDSGCTDRDRVRGMERERQTETKRSREGDKGRDRERERGQRNLPASSHSQSYMTSHDTGRRERQGSSKSSSRNLETRVSESPDQNAHKTERSTLAGTKFKGKDRPCYNQNHQDLSRSARKHFSSSLSNIRERDHFDSPRASSPVRELTQSRRRNERKFEKGGCKERSSSRSNSVSSSSSQESGRDVRRAEEANQPGAAAGRGAKEAHDVVD
uniref:E3 ubiquitin-protein ligase RBBP6 n=1 Tax=Semicossyphus pulcher TaxID=241346 RepID=UPI0037E7DCA2